MIRLLFLPLLALLLVACSDDDQPLPVIDPNCETAIRIIGTADTADISIDDGFDLISVTVDWPCLTVIMATSGCGNDDWTAQLITTGEVAESNPTQTSARFVFDDGVPNGVGCLAYFTDTFRFDLQTYLLPGTLPTRLTVMGPDSTLATILVE